MLASVVSDQFMQMLSECRQPCQVLKEMQCISGAIYYKKVQVTLIMATQESVP